MKTLNKGLFITVEGGDGSGKSTLVKRLKNHFISKDLSCITVRNPGGYGINEQLRNILLSNDDIDGVSRTLLNLTCIHNNIVNIIKPALDKNTIVISDRYLLTTYAYQCVAENIPLDKFKQMVDFISENTYANIEIILSVDPSIGLSRVPKNKRNVIEAKGLEYHTIVNSAFINNSYINNNNTCTYIVNTNTLSKDMTFSTVCSNIESYIKRKELDK